MKMFKLALIDYTRVWICLISLGCGCVPLLAAGRIGTLRRFSNRDITYVSLLLNDLAGWLWISPLVAAGLFVGAYYIKKKEFHGNIPGDWLDGSVEMESVSSLTDIVGRVVSRGIKVKKKNEDCFFLTLPDELMDANELHRHKFLKLEKKTLGNGSQKIILSCRWWIYPRVFLGSLTEVANSILSK